MGIAVSNPLLTKKKKRGFVPSLKVFVCMNIYFLPLNSYLNS